MKGLTLKEFNENMEKSIRYLSDRYRIPYEIVKEDLRITGLRVVSKDEPGGPTIDLIYDFENRLYQLIKG